MAYDYFDGILILSNYLVISLKDFFYQLLGFSSDHLDEVLILSTHFWLIFLFSDSFLSNLFACLMRF